MPDVLMPRLSDTMTEGTLSRWLMAEGDPVHRGDVLAEIETDKATMDLEAFDEGPLTKILVAEGSTVPIGRPVAVIGAPSGAGAAIAPSDAGDANAPGDTGHPTAPVPEAPRRVRATPLVRALARDHGIDLSTITGSGPGGRIVRVDIDAVLGRDSTAKPPAASVPAVQSAPATEAVAAPDDAVDDVRVPLSPVRRITAERLTRSAAAPHFHLTSIANVAALVDFAAQINADQAEGEERVSLTDLLVRACAVTLRAHPEVNASWAEDHIVQHGRVDVGVAVAIEQGLIVPVLRDADHRTVREISTQARALIRRARAGELTPDEFNGSTFTISNLGMFGISEFTAVINPPEAAILAVGAATEEPAVVGGEVTVTTRMRLTLTVDHRVLDGATAAVFLQDLVQLLEHPLRIVT